MRYLLLISVLFVENFAINDTVSVVEFVPIGKDTSATTPSSNITKSSSVISHKVFKEDGIKYTEIVRKTPSGGTQVAHIKGDVNPSILPAPVPNFSGLMRRIQEKIMRKMEEPSVPRQEFNHKETFSSLPRAEGPAYHRLSGFEPVNSQHQYPPPPYPPMMMYPPSPYSLVDRVESMTGNILDNVMEFVIGRRRR